MVYAAIMLRDRPVPAKGAIMLSKQQGIGGIDLPAPLGSAKCWIGVLQQLSYCLLVGNYPSEGFLVGPYVGDTRHQEAVAMDTQNRLTDFSPYHACLRVILDFLFNVLSSDAWIRGRCSCSLFSPL